MEVVLEPVDITRHMLDGTRRLLRRCVGDRPRADQEPDPPPFHGGIDTQRLLPFGKVEQVRERVQQIIEVVGAGGGYILAPDQLLQGDVPLENILAMYSAKRVN